MELFLFLSIGLSIVAFISIALHQDPTADPFLDNKIETVLPLESYVMTSDKMSILKIEDQVVIQNLEPIGQQRQELSSTINAELILERPMEATQL